MVRIDQVPVGERGKLAGCGCGFVRLDQPGDVERHGFVRVLQNHLCDPARDFNFVRMMHSDTKVFFDPLAAELESSYA